MDANSNTENVLWFIAAMKQYTGECDKNIYHWKRYNAKDDFNVLIETFNPKDNTVSETVIDRKGSVVTNNITVKLNGEVLPEESTKVISEMYRDTIIFLKEKIIVYDNNACDKNIILQKEEVIDDIIYLDILYENENILIKYAVYPDNKIKAEKYIKNFKIEESEQCEYYFNNTFVTYLSKSIYYINKDTSTKAEIKVGREEMIDENTALITMVYGNKDNGYNTIIEYVLKKYINLNGKIISYNK